MKKTNEAAKASVSLLNQLHDLVAHELIKKIKSGEASAQEINAAIKFLKDNNIEAEIVPNGDMDKLSKVVFPDFEDEET